MCSLLGKKAPADGRPCLIGVAEVTTATGNTNPGYVWIPMIYDSLHGEQILYAYADAHDLPGPIQEAYDKTGKLDRRMLITNGSTTNKTSAAARVRQEAKKYATPRNDQAILIANPTIGEFIINHDGLGAEALRVPNNAGINFRFEPPGGDMLVVIQEPGGKQHTCQHAYVDSQLRAGKISGTFQMFQDTHNSANPYTDAVGTLDSEAARLILKALPAPGTDGTPFLSHDLGNVSNRIGGVQDSIPLDDETRRGLIRDDKGKLLNDASNRIPNDYSDQKEQVG